MQAEYVVGKLEEAVHGLDHTSATLDMVVQGALSVEDAGRQANLGDVKPVHVDMDVFSRDSVVCHCAYLLTCSVSMLTLALRYSSQNILCACRLVVRCVK